MPKYVTHYPCDTCTGGPSPGPSTPIPGFRGGFEESKASDPYPLSRTASVGSSIADDMEVVEPVDSWGKHHPLSSLEGSPLTAQLHTRFAFHQLYTILTPMISGETHLSIIPSFWWYCFGHE